jgi:hypothetical protein
VELSEEEEVKHRRKVPSRWPTQKEVQGGRSVKNETKVTHSPCDRSRPSRDRGPICMLQDNAVTDQLRFVI